MALAPNGEDILDDSSQPSTSTKPGPPRGKPLAAPDRDILRAGDGPGRAPEADVIRRPRRKRQTVQDLLTEFDEEPPATPVEPAAPTPAAAPSPAKKTPLPQPRRKESAGPPAEQKPPAPAAPPAEEPVATGEPLSLAAIAKQVVTASEQHVAEVARAAPEPAAPPKPVAEPEPSPSAVPDPPVEAAAQPAAAAATDQPIQPEPHQRPLRHESGDVLLQTHGLIKVYDGRAVVDGVDINVREQEIVGLLGPNGAGKTTSFYMIVGLIDPNGGRVTFNNADATHEPMYKRARLGMGYLPQEESIFRKLTVEENIMAVLETQRNTAAERRERCHDLMKRFGIDKLAKHHAITLSGGEKRRLTIARSLVTDPKLLMLDEPFSGVDPIAVGEIQDIICDLREQGLAILITDHNVRETLGIVDRAYLIYEGKVLMEGSRDELVGNPEARKLYLGQSFSM